MLPACVINLLSSYYTIPEGVGEGFHSIFGRAVSSTNNRQSAQKTGHIYHPALGFFQQWQKLKGHVNDSYQIHVQDLCEILQLHPFCWTDRYGPASIIHQTPQTCKYRIKKGNITPSMRLPPDYMKGLLTPARPLFAVPLTRLITFSVMTNSPPLSVRSRQ